jgi:hypothetical protein
MHPISVNLPGLPGALVYMADLEALSTEQRARLVSAIAEKFNFPPAEVEADLDATGLPILADGVTVSSTDLAELMSFVGDIGLIPFEGADGDDFYDDDDDND